MLYLLLVGKNFYQGNIYKVVQDVASPFFTPSFPSPLPERIPQELVRITQKALEHEPQNRYQTAKELARELEFWLEGSKSQEKAKKLLKKIDEISQQEKDIRITLVQEYSLLQKSYQQARVITAKMWIMWQSYNQNKIRLRSCAHQKEKCMLNALIYAPDMQNIHKQIVETESERYKKFWIRGDNESLLQIERKVIIHLQQLPHQETRHWEDFKKRQQDSVNRQRREKGPFIGCQYHLQTIFDTLHQHPYLVLYGEAGIGKTRLALEIAAKWRDAHSVNAYFCNLQLCTTLTEAYHIIATTLGISTSTPNLFKEICSSLQNRSAVLIFDNIDNIQDDFVDMLNALETIGSNIKSLITTQKNTHIASQYCKRIPPLSIFASLELFLAKSRLYNPNLSFLEANRNYYLDIVHHLEGIPLAIEIFAAKLSVVSLHELHTHIRKSTFSTQETGLQKTLQWSWGLLSSSTQSTLKQCSLFQDGFFLDAAIGILLSDNHDSAYIIDQLDVLLQTQFIRKQTNKGKTRYYLLPAVSRFIHSRIQEDLRDTKIRFAEYFAQKYAPTFQKEDNHVYWEMRSIEKSNLIAAIRYGRITDAQICLQSILEVLYFQYEYRLGLQLLDLFLSRLTVQEQISHHFFAERVSLLFRLDKSEQAKEYIPKIEQHIKTGASKTFLAHWHNAQAKQVVSQKDISKTIVHLTRTLSLFQDQKNTAQIIELLIMLCIYHRQRNQFTIALDYILKAQRLAEEGPTQFLVRIYMQIGIFYKEQSNFQTALHYYQKAQMHMQRFPNESHLATIFFNIGNIYRTLGRLSEALHLYHQSMHIEVRLGNRISIIKIQNSIGLSHLNNGQYTKGVDFLKKAYSSARKSQKPFLISVIAGNIGEAYFKVKEYDLAIEKYKESLCIFQELNRKTSIAITVGNLCEIYLEIGNLPLANQYLQQALRLEPELSPLVRGFILGLCGQFHGQRNNPTQADAYFTKAESLLHDSPQNLFWLFEKKFQYYHNQHNEAGKSETEKNMVDIIETLEHETQLYMRSKLDALQRRLSYSNVNIDS
ncbi:MAG: hypothetical protein CL916_07540 [Deltaproteobacteria bacterium]|nr:hypothetical protein [Deltaproteobacteria bacterium]